MHLSLPQPRTAAGGDSPSSFGKVLIVDDLPANVQLLERLLTRDGYAVSTANNGSAALARVADELPDLVLMDVVMPGMNGFEVCRLLKSDPKTRLIPVVLITALTELEDRIVGIESGADDFLTKPINGAELSARARSLVRIKRFTDDLDSAESVILSLALTIEARDPCTDGHCQRLAAYAVAMGEALGLGEDDVSALARGGYLHDVGKVGIADAVLHKPGPLTREEFAHMQLHTVIGDRLCGELRSLRRVRPIVRHHHERLDGTGYPDQLRGDAIPLLAQIMSIVDIYDALTTARPYKAAFTQADALDILNQEAAKGWRRQDLVDEFVDLVERGRLPRATLHREGRNMFTVERNS